MLPNRTAHRMVPSKRHQTKHYPIGFCGWLSHTAHPSHLQRSINTQAASHPWDRKTLECFFLSLPAGKLKFFDFPAVNRKHLA